MCCWFLTAAGVCVQARGAFLDFIETALADTAIPITELKYRCAVQGASQFCSEAQLVMAAALLATYCSSGS